MTEGGGEASPYREERKVLTALFADLVGSTALAERLDPEDVKLVVGEAVARIVGEIEAIGGHVKDLAGDGVLAFFGAPTTREDDAERALRAALRIVQELDDYGREVMRGWGIDGFGVRVGVATGPVVVGEVGGGGRVEYAAFGDTVNLAARLQGAAEPGTVMVDAVTHRATGPLFAWGDEQRHQLKGKEQPVAAWPLTGLPAERQRLRGLPGVETRLIGRGRELGVGREALDRLRSGAGGLLTVSGEPGIGKSRLIAELRAAAERDGVRWLEGRCVSYGESLPYWPFRDLLRGEWIGAGADEPELRVRVGLRRRLDQLFGPAASELYPYLGTLLDVELERDAAARTAQLSPEALQWRTFEVVQTLFARLAEDVPLVIALEDLHWADPTSVQLLEQLLPLAEESAILLVLSMRLEREAAAWSLRELAAREYPHLLLQLDLGPISDAEQELLTALVGAGTLPPALERRILETAEGNPFFLEELVRSLADAGALVREGDGDRWRFAHDAPIDVPPTVEKVILARLDRLPPQSHEVLTAASTLGRTFALPLLEGVLEESPTEALHQLQRLELVQQSRRWPQAEFRFRHALIQETAYRTLVTGRRTGGPRPGSKSGTPDATPRCSVISPGTGWPRTTRTKPSTTSSEQVTRRGSSTRSTRPSRTTSRCCRCSRSAVRDRRAHSCCSSSRWRSTHPCASPTRTRPTNGRSRCGRRRPCRVRRRNASGSRPAICRTTPTPSRRSRGRTSSSACSSSTGWSRRGRSGRSSRRSRNAGRSPTTGCATSSTFATGCAGRTAPR